MAPRTAIGLLCLVVMAAVSVSASAQDEAGVAGALDDRARQVFEVGREAYSTGQYRVAAVAFERAYDMSGHTELLYNAGNAWDRSEETSRAAVALRHYLRAADEVDEPTELRSRIARLEAGETTLDESNEVVVDEAGDDDAGWLLGRRYTWLTAAVAVVSAVTAGALWSVATRRRSELADGCGASGGCTDEEIAPVEGLVTATNVALGLALAATAASVVVFFVEAPGGESDELGFGIAVRGNL